MNTSLTKTQGLYRFNTQANESERVHINRKGKVVIHPYPVTLSTHIRAINPTSQGFLAVLRVRQDMIFNS